MNQKQIWQHIEVVMISLVKIVNQNCENLNALVVGKMNDEINSITIKQFFGLNSIMHSMYSILVSNSSEHQKSKGCI